MRGTVPRIKLDLTNDERLVFDPVWQEVHHPYSDRPSEGIRALCYGYEELFAEKVRALAERMRPRDLYDVIHLYRHGLDVCECTSVVSALNEKCAFKGIPVPTPEGLKQHPERGELESEWKNMLGHQLPKLPSIAQFLDELPSVFAWLFGTATRAFASAMPVGPDIDRSWQPPAMAMTWGLVVPLEVIRFAAANRLCIDLDYVDAAGARARRLIEPYSLRKTKGGDVLLMASRHDSGEDRSYRVDRIKGTVTTDIPFVPRYAVELAATGPLVAPSRAPRTGLRRPSL